MVVSDQLICHVGYELLVKQGSYQKKDHSCAELVIVKQFEDTGNKG